MADPAAANHSDIIQKAIAGLQDGSLPPWKLESEMEATFGIRPPGNFRLAALCRRGFIEAATGEKFHYIQVPEKPYKVRYHCPEDDLTWELDARDDHHRCSFCGGRLEARNGFGALVANYVGGHEIYFSYAGRISVKGDVNRDFTNLLVYGTGLGPIGVTRGSFVVNRLGGAQVRTAAYGQAVRCNGYIFSTAALRTKARALIEANLPRIKKDMNHRLTEFSGRISAVEFKDVESHGEFILYIDFVAEFENFRGHGDISRAVGYAKSRLEAELRSAGIAYKMSVIAQGHDGDLKPSPNNKRGRYASAEVRIPVKDFERILKVDARKFLSFVKLDALGAENLGCQFYSGMGGEIIPAVYKAAQVNPQSPLVSAFQNITAREDKGDLVYGVELPNIEVGIASNREGLIPPVGREALRIMGIHTAREFAASLAAQVLAGEFNLALEISREKLYNVS